MQAKKLMRILRFINICVATLVIVLSSLSLIFVVIAAITSLKFFLIFSPVFMIAFGFAMLAAEFKIKFVLKRLPFLGNLLGKGLFNVYLSSVIYYYFDASDNDLLAWIGALSLFFTGVFYLCIHWGCEEKIQKKNRRNRNDEPQIQPSQARQPLM